MGIITLTTDFGIKDGNVGVMKGVIWSIAPEVQITDLSHMIGPQNVTEAALVVARSAPYFPPGTVHVVVVDPGVGTIRRPIAARLGSQFFIGPDNGFLTLLLERAEHDGEVVEVVHLDQPRYWLKEVSHVFHGRDIFSPCAAHIANGIALRDLGSLVHTPVRLVLPQPQRTPYGLQGEIIHMDHFGNISTNIRREHLGTPAQVTFKLCGFEIHGMQRTFGERPAGELIALYGSTGSLIFSVVNGSAAQRLAPKIGDQVDVVFGSSPAVSP